MRKNLFKPHRVTLIRRLQEDRAERLGRVAKLYIQGRFTMRQIANEIGNGVTVKQIERDINHIRQLWNKAASKDLKVYLSRELATIDRVEAECWEAWFKSQKTRTERSKGEEILSDGKTVLKRGRKTFDRTGEIAYMNTILSCVDRRTKLLGLSEKERGDGDDIQIHAVEVIVHSREQAKSMVEYEEFRTSIKQRG